MLISSLSFLQYTHLFEQTTTNQPINQQTTNNPILPFHTYFYTGTATAPFPDGGGVALHVVIGTHLPVSLFHLV